MWGWSVLDAFAVAAAALWGAVVGALLPRPAYRLSVPAGEPWRVVCPGGHPVRGWLGWGRCAGCAECAADETGRPPSSYGPRTPLVSLTTALLCAVLALAVGTRPDLAVWLLLTPVGVLLALVDLRVRRLPDVLTLPLAVAAPVLLGLLSLVPEHTGHWPTALYGGLALGAFYYLLYRVNPGGMGFGDVKLALGAGTALAWYGWPTLLLGTFAGFLLGALYGGALVVTRRANRKTTIPFGPFLIAGAFVGLLIGAYTV